MKTIKIEILDDKAINLLKNLEDLNIIRIHSIDKTSYSGQDFINRYRGVMSKQLPGEIDKQLNELHNEWD